jgi:hypothetical protein
MPDWSSSTPAWDPSSRTPTVDPSSQTPLRDPPSHTPVSNTLSQTATPALTSTLASSSQAATHPLLDARLIGAVLKVMVDGADHKKKELVISVSEVDRQVKIRHTIYKTSTNLQPDSVLPKHPNATRDNGLLVVIKGEHCGKYVRRIHHRHDDDQTVMILAVVKRVDGKADILTGERLELAVDSLCIGMETQEEKKLNSSLMSSLRSIARG